MAKGGRGGRGGRGGASKAGKRAISRISRSRNRSKVGKRRNNSKSGRQQEQRDSQNLQNETQSAFNELDNAFNSKSFSSVGRKLGNLVKDRYKGGKVGRARRRTEAQRERERVHSMARMNLDRDIDRFSTVDANGDGILSPGQRGMLNQHVGPAMRSAARNPGARGSDLYKAADGSHASASDALGDLMHYFADSYDFIMDVAQTFTQLAQDANSDN